MSVRCTIYVYNALWRLVCVSVVQARAGVSMCVCGADVGVSGDCVSVCYVSVRGMCECVVCVSVWYVCECVVCVSVWYV